MLRAPAPTTPEERTMTDTQTSPALAPPTSATPSVPGRRLTAATLAGAGIALAVGEQLVGDLDQADDVALIAAGSDRLAAGILLCFAAAGLGRLVWPSITGRIGWVLLMVAVPCAGAFAAFHLILLETGAPGLDQAAMQQFVVERFQGPGPWGIPIGLFALLGPLALLLVLIALVRLRTATVAAPAALLVGFVLDQVPGDGALELVALWLVALGLVLAAVGLWRGAR